MGKGQKVLGIKIDPALERDIQKACGGICSKSKLAKQAILKELAYRKSLSLDAANKTIPVDGYKTLNCCQTSDEDSKTGIVTLYDLTASFVTHILVPFKEGGETFYRDQNGYKWEYGDDEGPGPVFTEDGECKDLSELSSGSTMKDTPNDHGKQEKFISHSSSPYAREVVTLNKAGELVWTDHYDESGKLKYREYPPEEPCGKT